MPPIPKTLFSVSFLHTIPRSTDSSTFPPFCSYSSSVSHVRWSSRRLRIFATGWSFSKDGVISWFLSRLSHILSHPQFFLRTTPSECLTPTLLPRARSRAQPNRAPNISKVYKDESESTASLVDVDSPHVTTVDSSFLEQDVKTSTQAERIEREEEEAAKEKKARTERKAKAKSSGIRNNKSNPVYLGNAVLLSAIGAGLGFGAYRKHLDGKLSWQLVGLWSGAVGAFGAVDYFVSKWFLQNKYPPK
ncbi:uncharacterized protein LDX57_001475 [Aspergillus melleus]|uniref:uncharacterized protein n=1 Tax=Aspergillus melleus TaxID=138277 RepID=UPI001E8D77D4|nr:pyruvate dehydrogenase complex dihydrolipoamide acetyltransferase component (E2) [Aspergillus melleus]KAH8423719.1 pyruvate dehydrogenase complex dihydrolipoamide acetyltransferase component (E2) [Aspergillus melleus]